MKTALDVHRELLAREVRHEIVQLRHRVASADDLPRMLDLSDGCVAVRCYAVTAAVVVSAGSEPPPAGVVAVLVPAGTLPDAAALLEELGALAVRPATADEINLATDFAATLVSPVGLPPEVPLLVDRAVAARHVLYAAAGEGGVALGIRTEDLLRVTGARVASLRPTRVIDADEAAELDRLIDLTRHDRAPHPPPWPAG